jgi:hypothetical protein
MTREGRSRTPHEGVPAIDPPHDRRAEDVLLGAVLRIEGQVGELRAEVIGLGDRMETTCSGLDLRVSAVERNGEVRRSWRSYVAGAGVVAALVVGILGTRLIEILWR